jgi:hypothetical protein
LSSVTSIVLGMNASSTFASAPAARAHKGKATIAETISTLIVFDFIGVSLLAIARSVSLNRLF